jgi:hypothetical protein
VLLSGSTDGLVNLYDTTIADEDDALLQVINHGSVHRAGFLGEAAIYVLSHDEFLSIYPVNSPDGTAAEPAAVHFGDLRTFLSCDYVIQLVGAGGGTYVAAGSTRFEYYVFCPYVPLDVVSVNTSIFAFQGAENRSNPSLVITKLPMRS